MNANMTMLFALAAVAALLAVPAALETIGVTDVPFDATQSAKADKCVGIYEEDEEGNKSCTGVWIEDKELVRTTYVL